MNGRTILPSGPGSDEPARCYESMAEVAEDFRQLFDRHGEALVAVFEAAWPETRRREGRRASEKGAVVSLSLEASNVAEAQQ